MTLLHLWNDFSVLLAFFGEILRSIASGVIRPVSFSYNFLFGVVQKSGESITATTTAEITDVYGTSTLSVLHEIPYWETLSTLLGVAILIIGAVAIIKLFTSL